MKTVLHSVLITVSLGVPLAADVNVTIPIGEPGYYGFIEIGDFPRPRLIYREPVLVSEVAHSPPPVYLVVPPGHAKRWPDYCHDYGYCGQPVYFVEPGWYQEVYVPEYRKRHGHPGKGKGKGNGKDQKDQH
jgi:hypothetical protein